MLAGMERAVSDGADVVRIGAGTCHTLGSREALDEVLKAAGGAEVWLAPGANALAVAALGFLVASDMEGAHLALYGLGRAVAVIGLGADPQ